MAYADCRGSIPHGRVLFHSCNDNGESDDIFCEYSCDSGYQKTESHIYCNRYTGSLLLGYGDKCIHTADENPYAASPAVPHTYGMSGAYIGMACGAFAILVIVPIILLIRAKTHYCSRDERPEFTDEHVALTSETCRAPGVLIIRRMFRIRGVVQVPYKHMDEPACPVSPPSYENSVRNGRTNCDSGTAIFETDSPPPYTEIPSTEY